MKTEEIYRFEQVYEQPQRNRLAVQEAAEILGVRAHTLRYGSARYETQGLDPVEPAWARAVPLDELLEFQELR
ncbi:MAG: MerR family transcriptional regulator [Gammaproteobacteria bacterium]